MALKVGSSPAGQLAALAHTGAVAGDDAVVGSVLRQLNVIRVTSIEDMLTTAALLGYNRWPGGRRMGVLTASGGACDIIADRASEHQITIPPFAEETAAAITPLLPPFASARNPLDVTGYVLANQRTGALTAIDHALDVAVEDPGLDFIAFSGVTLPDVQPPDERIAAVTEARVAWLGERARLVPDPDHPDGSGRHRRQPVRRGTCWPSTTCTFSAGWTTACGPSAAPWTGSSTGAASGTACRPRPRRPPVTAEPLARDGGPVLPGQGRCPAGPR